MIDGAPGPQSRPVTRPPAPGVFLRDSHYTDRGSEQQLPALSTYLGHACVRDTYWYLSACPELMEEAARRLDRCWEAKP